MTDDNYRATTPGSAPGPDPSNPAPADRTVSVSRVVAAPAGAIFDVLADPTLHRVIDGSGTVRDGRDGNPDRLFRGARFSMGMRMGVPYRTTSEVTEFEEGRLIAWRHFGHHVWRYELEPVDGGTRVTETFDWGTSRFPPLYEWLNLPDRHRTSMVETLARLDRHVTAGDAA
ncbi:MAG: SRPBCC family protein [Acidimicrobiales bacterium]